MVTLYDQYNKPIKKADLTEEKVLPLTGVRDSVFETIASKLTPTRLVQIIEEAKDGDPVEWLTLCEEIEEDPHYGSVLSTRKLAISGAEPTIEAASDDTKDIDLADAIRSLISKPAFFDLVESMTDALGKGFSVCEINWDTSGKKWEPKSYIWRDPRWFYFHRDTDQIHIRETTSHPEQPGTPLAPYKFIVHYANLRKSKKILSGLARLAISAQMCKRYAIKDWMRFIELFGMPVRIGRYGNGASPTDISILKRAVYGLGVDAAAVIPDSMKLELIQPTSGKSNSDTYQKLCDWLDKQVSKGVLGQTMTTDDGSSQSQANVHEKIRQDLLVSDLRNLSATLNEQLIIPYIRLNYGIQENYPTLKFPQKDGIDIEAICNLVDRGLEIEQSVIRNKVGLPDPEKNAKILRPISSNQQPETGPMNNIALNASDEDPVQDEAEEALKDWKVITAIP